MTGEQWEHRRDGERTNVYLERVLRSAGLDDMADKALAFHYDDYFCPPEVDDGMNMQRLVADLTRARDREHRHIERGRITAMIAAVKVGEFDGTSEESEEWAKSADGKATMRTLYQGVHEEPSA